MKIGPTERSREVLWYGLPSPLAPGPYEDRLCPFIRIYGSEKTCILETELCCRAYYSFISSK